MNFNELEEEIALLKKDADEICVGNNEEFQAAKGASNVCSKMRIQVVKFADALQAAQKTIDVKCDEYARKPKAEKKPVPAPAPKMILDDFDEEPPSAEDELAIEMQKSLF
jgi:hypothetical protein